MAAMRAFLEIRQYRPKTDVKRSHARGFTLIEVLISVFVLALGVIGAAGMQLTAMRTTQQSSSQSIAMQLATEMADLMRTNSNQMMLGDASNPFLGVSYKSTDTDPTAPTLCYTSGCTPVQLAAFDIYEWEMRVKGRLPGGRVEICRDATPWDSTAGALKWCPTTASTTTTDPMVIKIGWYGKGQNPDGSTSVGTAYPPSIAVAVEAYSK